MGNVLSMTKKDEKGEANDATPTSSTDASITSSAAQTGKRFSRMRWKYCKVHIPAVSDDPISSTSSDVIEQNKIRDTTTTSQAEISLDRPNALPMAASISDASTVDADLLEMGMSNVPHEKITEDVEDLVQDLENLLGETPSDFYVPRKSVKETVKEKVCEAAETSTKIAPEAVPEVKLGTLFNIHSNLIDVFIFNFNRILQRVKQLVKKRTLKLSLRKVW